MPGNLEGLLESLVMFPISHAILKLCTYSNAIENIPSYLQNVKMAHAIMRVAFSTCSPDTKLFAYVAKSGTSVTSQSILQAHVFKAKKASHVCQLLIQYFFFEIVLATARYQQVQ